MTQHVAPFLLLILVGLAAGRLKLFTQDGLGQMTVFLLYVALPAMFVLKLSSLDLPVQRALAYLLIFGLAHLVNLAAGIAWQRFVLKQTPIEAVSFAAAGTWPNTGFIGVVVATAFLGNQGLLIALSCVVMEVVVIATTMLSLKQTGKGPKVKQLVASLVRALTLNPYLIAIALGVAASLLSLPIPSILAKTLSYLSDTVMCLALFCVGLGLALRPVGNFLKAAPTVLSIVGFKLLFHPAVMAVLAWLLGFQGLEYKIIVAMGAMPVAVNAFIFVSRYGKGDNRVSAAILLSTLLSFLSLGLIMGF